MQLSRNNLSPFGSWKQYKRCCIGRTMYGNECYPAEYEEPLTALPFLILIEDLLDDANTSKARECVVILGIIAWNISVRGGQSPDILKNFAKTLNAIEEYKEQAGDIIQYLIEQKNILFPEHDRIILDFSLQDTKDKLRLKLTYGAKAA